MKSREPRPLPVRELTAAAGSLGLTLAMPRAVSAQTPDCDVDYNLHGVVGKTLTVKISADGKLEKEVKVEGDQWTFVDMAPRSSNSTKNGRDSLTRKVDAYEGDRLVKSDTPNTTCGADQPIDYFEKAAPLATPVRNGQPGSNPGTAPAGPDTRTEQRVSALEQGHKDLGGKIENAQRDISQQIGQLGQALGQRLDGIDQRLTGIEQTNQRQGETIENLSNAQGRQGQAIQTIEQRNADQDRAMLTGGVVGGAALLTLGLVAGFAALRNRPTPENVRRLRQEEALQAIRESAVADVEMQNLRTEENNVRTAYGAVVNPVAPTPAERLAIYAPASAAEAISGNAANPARVRRALMLEEVARDLTSYTSADGRVVRLAELDARNDVVQAIAGVIPQEDAGQSVIDAERQLRDLPATDPYRRFAEQIIAARAVTIRERWFGIPLLRNLPIGPIRYR